VNAMILDDPRDAAKLADAIGRVLDQAGLREQLTHGAREFAANFQWPEIAARQLTVYFSALGASN
uniref:glycosyltransferase n=1 Tax=Polaromonas sp. TaxID=1869339 RepID=UPI00386219C4